MGNTPKSFNPFKEWKDQSLREKIKELQRKVSPYCEEEPLRLVLCGDTGVGKSSLINNIISALRGEYVQIINVVGSSAASITRKYKEYEITLKDETQKKTLMVLCDTQGIGQDDTTGHIEAIKKALEGKFASGQKMEDTEKRSGSWRKHAVYVIIVCDATLIGPYDDASRDPHLRAIQSYAKTESIPMCIFLTKCDRLDVNVANDIRTLYTSEKVNKVISITSHMFNQFPKGRIFPIVNYTDQRKAEPSMMLQTLYALQEIVKDVEASMSSVVG